MTMLHTPGRPVEHDVVLDPTIDDLLLRLRGMVLVRDLLEERGAPAEDVATHSREADRLRAELARLIGGDAAGMAAA